MEYSFNKPKAIMKGEDDHRGSMIIFVGSLPDRLKRPQR